MLHSNLQILEKKTKSMVGEYVPRLIYVEILCMNKVSSTSEFSWLFDKMDFMDP